jgi:NTP pyrophosphatase (non-canonical NTP hydrolase)
MDMNHYQKEAFANRGHNYNGTKVVYPALGLGGESGEVLDNVKKMCRDDDGVLTPSRLARLTSEMGDVLWYLSALADDLGVSLSDIAEENLRKIKDRRSRNMINGEGNTR